MQSNQRFIEELQINITAFRFELCQLGLQTKHKHTSDTDSSACLHTLSVCIHLHVSRVFVCAASVGDNVEVALVCLCHYEVIVNPSFVIGEEGQRTLKGEQG